MAATPQRSVLTTVTATLIGFALFASLVVLIFHLAGTPEDVEAKRALERAEILREIQGAASEELNKPAWVEKEKGLVRIPIERAMELTVQELKSKPVRATAEVANPVPSAIVPPPASY